MLVVVVYDIADQKRRTKLATFLEGYGRRVQKSVFECFMGLAEMRKLQKALVRRIHLPDDNVRLYWLSADAVPRTLTLGSEPPTEPPKVYII
jgi:CRISPR-associated protein Cas2